MFKINLANSFFCVFIKYIIFFFILAFIGNRFNNAVIDKTETSLEMFQLTFKYILTVLLYSIPLILVFGFILYFILKMKRCLYFMLSIVLFFIVEYIFYTYFYSPSDKLLGLYNTVIGVIILGLFFHKTIRSKFTES